MGSKEPEEEAPKAPDAQVEQSGPLAFLGLQKRPKEDEEPKAMETDEILEDNVDMAKGDEKSQRQKTSLKKMFKKSRRQMTSLVKMFKTSQRLQKKTLKKSLRPKTSPIKMFQKSLNQKTKLKKMMRSWKWKIHQNLKNLRLPKKIPKLKKWTKIEFINFVTNAK